MKKTGIFLFLITSIFLTAMTANAQSAVHHKQYNHQPTTSKILNSKAIMGGSLCETPTLYEQPFDAINFNFVRTSDAGPMFLVSENLVDGAGNISPLVGGITDSIRVWGVSLEFMAGTGFIGACTDDDSALTEFNVIFSEDNAGVPGAVITSVVATPTAITDTTIPFSFTTVFQWDLSFPETDVAGAAWVSIQRQTGVGTPSGNQCLFLWLDEISLSTYDNSAHQNDAAVTSDHVFCLNEVDTDLIFKNGFE